MNDQAIAEPGTKLARIEEKLDRNTLADVAASTGGVQFRTMTEVMEFAKLVSLSGVAVPPHLRGNPGACLAVCIQAMEWKMSPFAVANKSYVVANYSKDGPIERLSYESQLLHAVIEARAPLKGRLRVDYDGEGDERICIVSGTFRGETQPHELRSPPLGKRRPGLNEKGYSKGSPLWYSKPDTQQFYDTSRDWARMYCPDILMGLYTPDEIEEYAGTPIEPKDVSPNLMQRLPGAAQQLDREVVDNALATHANEPEPEKPAGAKGKRQRKSKATPEPTAAKTTGEVYAEASGVKAGTITPLSVELPEPKNAVEYAIYAEDWIGKITAETAEMAEGRYHSEQDLRDICEVPIKERKRLNDLVVEKVNSFMTNA